jgi:two-component system, sensor histidine kinase and response regulator
MSSQKQNKSIERNVMNNKTEVSEVVNVLVVDDNTANLIAIEAILKGQALNIVRASSGNEALSHLLEKDFACIVLDVRMPEMDGFELAKIIRADERTKYIPIIFASGEQATADVFKGYETGAIDYLIKPLEPVIVRSKIHVFAELYRRELARNRAEAALAKYADELRRSNAELDQYASVVAHDLQAPLRRIVACVGMINESYREKLGGEAESWFKMMTDNAKRMQSLIEDLLTYAKVGREQKPEKMDLAKVISEVIADLSMPIEESRTKISYQNMPTVTAGALDLRQLMQNLIGNAIKYRKKNMAPEVHISAERRGSFWSLRVKDNGIGIDPAFKEKLFVLFGRLHNDSEYSGTGIGLAICKKIVERYGGKIWVESALESGSTFHLTLPDSGEIKS